MSAFSPEVLPPIHADRPKTVARFLPTALRRVPSVAKPWGVGKLVVFGLLTFGYYPCHALHTRVRETLAMHAQQFELAVAWFAARLPADDASVLTAATAKLRSDRVLSAVGSGLLLASLACFAVRITTRVFGPSATWAQLLVSFHPIAIAAEIFLSLAYLLAVVRMNRQIVAVQQLVLAFNAALDRPADAIRLPPMAWGLRPMYVIAGVLMAALGLIWALPMMLAWAALKDFSESAVRGVRVALGERMTADSGVAPLIAPAALCTNPDCRLVSPPEATFCPRCGRSTRPAA